MKKTITLMFVLLICVGTMSHQPIKYPQEETIFHHNATVCWYYLKGTIGNNNVRMYLADPNDKFTGQYFYVSQGFDNQIDLTQSYYDMKTGHLVLNEFVDGMRTGKFDGYLKDGGGEGCSAVYTGTFTNFNGKKFKFKLYDDPMSPYGD